MKFAFWKMHGAGNDFILMDDRSLAFPAADTSFIARLCDRRRGIGAEGLLLVQPSVDADFRMRFFNPDGSEADLCGNGARCIARLAREIGAAPAQMRIETAAGQVRADIPPPPGPPPSPPRGGLALEHRRDAGGPTHDSPLRQYRGAPRRRPRR